MPAENSHTRKCMFIAILITIEVLAAINARASTEPNEARVDVPGAVSIAPATPAPEDSYEAPAMASTCTRT